jgi:hypothetical protein
MQMPVWVMRNAVELPYPKQPPFCYMALPPGSTSICFFNIILREDEGKYKVFSRFSFFPVVGSNRIGHENAFLVPEKGSRM